MENGIAARKLGDVHNVYPSGPRTLRIQRGIKAAMVCEHDGDFWVAVTWSENLEQVALDE